MRSSFTILIAGDTSPSDAAHVLADVVRELTPVQGFLESSETS